MGKQTKLQGVLTLNALSSEEHEKQAKDGPIVYLWSSLTWRETDLCWLHYKTFKVEMFCIHLVLPPSLSPPIAITDCGTVPIRLGIKCKTDTSFDPIRIWKEPKNIGVPERGANTLLRVLSPWHSRLITSQRACIKNSVRKHALPERWSS